MLLAAPGLRSSLNGQADRTGSGRVAMVKDAVQSVLGRVAFRYLLESLTKAGVFIDANAFVK